MKVVIVGAGILGLSTAWALVRQGHEAVVLEQGPVPNPKGASVDRHRAIRFAYGPAHGYTVMVGEAYAAWDRLWAGLGARHYVETGHLMLGAPDEPWISASLRSLGRLGLEAEHLDRAALGQRFPMIATDRIRDAVWTPRAGFLLADRIVGALADALAARGQPVRAETPVQAVDLEGAAVRLQDGDTLAADAVLVAAGAWTGRLVPALAGLAVPSRQAVAYLDPPPALAPAWHRGPVLTWVDPSSDEVLYALPDAIGAGVKIGDHRFSRGGDPGGDRIATRQEIDRLLGVAGRVLADIGAYRAREARACFYTVTEDERFTAVAGGRGMAVSACSGHGFKFGALLGERTAAALLGETPFADYARWLAGATPDTI